MSPDDAPTIPLAVTVHRVDRPDFTDYGYEVRRGGVVVASGLIRLDGSLFAAWPDETRSPTLWSPTSVGVLARLAHEHGGVVVE